MGKKDGSQRPIDFEPVPIAKRLRGALEAQNFAMSLVRGRLRRAHPNLSQRQINLLTLQELTSVRMNPFDKATSMPGFYFDVLSALEEIGAPYMIIGAFAALAYGSTRLTFDIDIVVDLSEEHILALAERYPPPRYYADPEQMRDSIRRGILFNLIDTSQGQKVDLIPLSMEPRYREAFLRRRRHIFETPEGKQFEAWFARPEDVILGKLMAWAEGHSSRHEEDIQAMLAFLYSGLDSELVASYEESRIDRSAAEMGQEVSALWEKLKAKARDTQL